MIHLATINISCSITKPRLYVELQPKVAYCMWVTNVMTHTTPPLTSTHTTIHCQRILLYTFMISVFTTI